MELIRKDEFKILSNPGVESAQLLNPDNSTSERVTITRGSHRLPKEQALEKIKRGEIPLEPLTFGAGDVLIRDPRCLHRGSPNRSDRPRAVAVIGCERPWLRRGQATQQSRISRAVWDGLSEFEKKVLARFESFVAD